MGGDRSDGPGLTTRTSVAAVAVFAPFVAALVLLSIAYFHRQYEDGIGRHQLLLASRVAADLDQRLRSSLQTLARIAEAIEPEMLADPARGQRFLDDRITLHLLFDEGLSIVTNEGVIVVESPADGAGRRRVPPDGAWREVARTGRGAIAESGLAHGGPPGVGVELAVPIRGRDGRVVGQLHGGLRANGPNLAGDLATVTIGQRGFFILVARDRHRLVHPDPARVNTLVAPGVNRAVDRAIDEGFEGVTRSTCSTGVPMLAAVRRMETTGWVLVANMPLDEVGAPFRAARPLYAGAAGLGVLLLVGAVWASLRRATRPLVRMTAAAERIAADPAPGRRIGERGVGEVGRLAAAFDRLLQALEAREAARGRAEEDRRALEARLGQQQRLESLGVLAGGIAHDFNNLLTPIIANATLALEDLPPGHPLRGDMEEMAAAARRGADLARRILAFSRRQVIETHRVNLNEVLRALEKALRAVVGEAVELRLATSAGPAWVRADPTQLQQAVVALAANARDAMPAGGILTIGVEPAEAEGRPVVLTVADTGEGISAAILPRIFEPFFTTRGAAGRSGMGLATVHGIVQQHGGEIDVECPPGGGAVFRVRLPAGETAPEPAPALPPSPVAAPRPLRILLVEDEPVVRALAGRILRRAGHEVVVVGSPGEALASPEEARPDLLVSDVLLPEMDGIELHRRLARRWPGLPVLFMSGFPGGNARLEDAIANGRHFLQKPFGPGDLLGKVEEAAREGDGSGTT